MKKIIIIMAILFFGLCAAVFAQHEYGFTINTNTGLITAYEGPGGDVMIPQRISGILATGIAELAFENRHITSISIPPSVRTIGAQAFAGNPLTSIRLGDNVEMVTSAFPISFISSYLGGNDGKGGLYTRDDNIWTLQETGILNVYQEEEQSPNYFTEPNDDEWGEGPITITIFNYVGNRENFRFEDSENTSNSSTHSGPPPNINPPGNITLSQHTTPHTPAQMRIIPGYPDPQSSRMHRLQVGAFSSDSESLNWVSRILHEAGFTTTFEQAGNNTTRVIITGIPSSGVYGTITRLGTLGFNEIWVRD